jgi:hypothetical protein
MKVRSIPAQITSVEDKIAGNLNLTQIVLFMLPLFWLMLVYTLFLPHMSLTLYKIPLIVVVSLVCFILAIRVKEKIILHWLQIILTFNLRAKYYVFNKNDEAYRTMDLPVVEKKEMHVSKKQTRTNESRNTTLPFGQLAKLEYLLANPDTNLSVRINKKGGVYVDLKQKH